MKKQKLLTAPIITCLILLVSALDSKADDPYSRSYMEFTSENPTRFFYSVYEPNTASIREPSHPEFNLSMGFKLNHLFYKPDYQNSLLQSVANFFWKSKMGFVYMGDYGFYFGSWHSGPVLSRKQNPYAYVEHGWMIGKNSITIKQTLWAHESNGMYLDNDSLYEKNVELFKKSGLDIDSRSLVSMGWNYYSTRLDFINRFGSKQIVLTGESRFFVPQDNPWPVNIGSKLEDSVFYDPTKISTHIYDYDGLRLGIKYEFGFLTNWKGVLNLNARCGLPGMTDSVKISSISEVSIQYYFKSESIGPYLSYHRGYGRDLATYPVWYERLNFGIEAGF